MIHRYSNLLEEILKIVKSVKDDEEFKFNYDEFRKQFLLEGSCSPNNLEAIQYIEYGKYPMTVAGEYVRDDYGFKVKDKNVSLTDIFVDVIECNDEVIKSIQKNFPELTDKETEAALRCIAILLCSMECNQFLEVTEKVKADKPILFD